MKRNYTIQHLSQGQFQPILFYFGPVVSEKNAFNIDFFRFIKTSIYKKICTKNHGRIYDKGLIVVPYFSSFQHEI